MRILSFIFLLFIVFSSCSKQEILSRSTIENLAANDKVITNFLPGSCPYNCTDTRCKAYFNGYCGTTPTDTITAISNPNNPEESVGTTHNQGMYAIMPNYMGGNLQPTNANVMAYTKAFLVSKHNDSSIINSTNTWMMQTYGGYAQVPSINTQATTLYNNGTISAVGKSYLNQLSTKLSAFCAGADTVAATQAKYSAFANSLITLENQIKSSTTLTANDKYILNSAYANARYSTVYNCNYAIENYSYSPPPSSLIPAPSRTPRFLAWFHVTECCGADVAGAVGGAAFGVVAGLGTGGVLTPATVATASLATCIGTSVYDAGYQTWSHFFGN